MDTKQKIAVIGATGRVGGPLVESLESAGREVVAISRSRGVDVISGDGLYGAFEGVHTVVDASNGSSPDEESARKFFVTSATNVQSAGERAGVRQIVVVSIIGCDRFAGGGLGGYYVAKAAHEQALLKGPIPVQILRAAQFHEFVSQLVDRTTQDGVAYVPNMRMQLVAASTVAAGLADLATQLESNPADGGSVIPEIAGPETETLLHAARLVAERRGSPGRVELASDIDDPDQELFAGNGLLPSPDATLAGPTFAQWLESPSARVMIGQ